MFYRLSRQIFTILALTTAQAHAQRPLVLIVHGRGQVTRDSAELRRSAFEALQGGIRQAYGDSVIGSGDVRLIWYADVMDRRARASTSNACTALGALEGTPREAPFNAVTMLASIAGALVEGAASDAADSNSVSLRSLSADLRYLGDADTRCAAELRVARAVADAAAEHRPIILVSHSLGAMVTWDYLTHHKAATPSSPDVLRWVTLGSPLASVELRTLLFGDETPLLALPPSVGSWINVMGTGDSFAAALASSDSRIQDVHTDGSHSDSHELSGYLSDPATVRAIVSAWCSAASDGSRVCRP